MLYLAYGSNLNKKQMSKRCPKARAIGKYILSGHVLEFRRVANIRKTTNLKDKIACGIWKITESCERALDIYEGYPSLYGKKNIKLDDGREVMTYFMNSGILSPPSKEYLNTIQEGSKHFDLPSDLLFNISLRKIYNGNV